MNPSTPNHLTPPSPPNLAHPLQGSCASPWWTWRSFSRSCRRAATCQTGTRTCPRARQACNSRPRRRRQRRGRGTAGTPRRATTRLRARGSTRSAARRWMRGAAATRSPAAAAAATRRTTATRRALWGWRWSCGTWCLATTQRGGCAGGVGPRRAARSARNARARARCCVFCLVALCPKWPAMLGCGCAGRGQAFACAPPIARAPHPRSLALRGSRSPSQLRLPHSLAPSSPPPPALPAQVLRGVSLAVRSGESLAIVGGSGSGKSTILKLVTRLYDALRGDILVGSGRVGRGIRGIGGAHTVWCARDACAQGTTQDGLPARYPLSSGWLVGLLDLIDYIPCHCAKLLS